MQHKYRAWDPYTKTMNYDCRDSLSLWNGLVVPEGDHVPLRWTGLHDKNGKEIYEGDLIRVLDAVDTPYIVNTIWDDENACWHRARDYRYGEIIGNIYENSDLLN